jgi:hypothetical protein
MTTERGVEYNQMFLNACVQLDGLCLMTVLMVTQPRSLGIAKHRTSVGQSILCLVTSVKNHLETALKSPDRMANNALR